MFLQYIFSRNSRRVVNAGKFAVSENYNHNRTNGINRYICAVEAQGGCVSMHYYRRGGGVLFL